MCSLTSTRWRSRLGRAGPSHGDAKRPQLVVEFLPRAAAKLLELELPLELAAMRWFLSLFTAVFSTSMVISSAHPPAPEALATPPVCPSSCRVAARGALGRCLRSSSALGCEPEHEDSEGGEGGWAVAVVDPGGRLRKITGLCVAACLLPGLRDLGFAVCEWADCPLSSSTRVPEPRPGMYL